MLSQLKVNADAQVELSWESVTTGDAEQLSLAETEISDPVTDTLPAPSKLTVAFEADTVGASSSWMVNVMETLAPSLVPSLALT